MFIGELPGSLALRIHFDDKVASSAVDQGVAIRQADGSESPVRCCGFPGYLSIGRIFADDFIQELWNQIIAVGEFSCHASLQMVISGLASQRDVYNNCSVGIDLEDSRMWPGFGEKDISRGQFLRSVDFGLSALEFEQGLAATGDFDYCAAGIFVTLGKGQ